MYSAPKGKDVSTHYWPGRLEVLPGRPRTASGKIQKFRLRELVGTSAPLA